MPKVRIRAARAADKADVEALCAEVWEDAEDYVPRAWDGWLADPHGKLAVAQLGGCVVGVAKLTRLADDEWWLEGLRVSPDHRRRGVAGRLQAHLVEEFRRIGQGTLRFGTHSRNEPVHRLAARDGFRRAATYRLYEAAPLAPDQAPPLRPLREDDLEAAWGLVDGSPRYRAAAGLYETFWSWQRLTRPRLAEELAQGRGRGVDQHHQLAALALLCQTDKEDALDVAYVDGRGAAVEAALRSLRALAARRGCDKLRLRAVDEPGLVAAAAGAGYEPGWDRDLWIFELAAGTPPTRISARAATEPQRLDTGRRATARAHP
ncbi:MAG: GNAT family N-acetyltransferase [Chloroflexota bacterium]